jgi:gamma-glutamyltranspeptidase/glutathione hydrolase
MSASIVARNGKPVMATGSAGDERIISGVIQVISHFLDVRKGIEAAVAAPRIHCLRVEEVLLETRPQDLKAVLSLEQRGYTVHQPLSSLFSGELNPYFGGIHAVAMQDDRWTGAADPRRDGAVARMTSV